VLDGFPRTYEDSKAIFYYAKPKPVKLKPEKVEGEGDEDA